MPVSDPAVYLQTRDIRQLAEQFELRPSKSKGQNFLCDANTVRKIVGLSGVGPGDRVLEVGPGFGSLTIGLLAAGASVTAVEIDPRLAEATAEVARRRLPEAPLQMIRADALQLDTVDPDIRYLVANLPYNIAVPVVLHLLALHPGFRRVLVMVQAEVGWRIAADPGTGALRGTQCEGSVVGPLVGRVDHFPEGLLARTTGRFGAGGNARDDTSWR